MLEAATMNETRQFSEKKPYQKPELKVVKFRPREVLGNECHNSANTGPSPCDYSTCAD